MDGRCSRGNREATKKEAFAIENLITKTTRIVLSYDASRGTVSKDRHLSWKSYFPLAKQKKKETEKLVKKKPSDRDHEH